MPTERSRHIIFALVLTLAILTLAGCGFVPAKAALSDPKIEPMIKALDTVDRASLGFSPIPTNAQITLELQPAGRPYDAMLHVYGDTSRTIAFRKTVTGYRWIGEQEIYQGPKWRQTVDGTFREEIDIEFQTEPGNGIPTNHLSIQYIGSDTNLTAREFTLAEVRPILKKWEQSPLEPRPPDLPGSDFGTPVGMLLVLLAFLALLVGCSITLAAAVVISIVTAIALAVGIISTSFLVGILRRSVASGFRTLFIQLGAVAGMVDGTIVMYITTHFFRTSWNLPKYWIMGIVLGLLLGVSLALIFNMIWGRIARALPKYFGTRN
jgi:hypothetical protein